jgi:hypothetical protein
MVAVIFSILGVVVYGILIAIFWEDVHPAIASIALQYYISPETLDWLQPDTGRRIRSDAHASNPPCDADWEAPEPSGFGDDDARCCMTSPPSTTSKVQLREKDRAVSRVKRNRGLMNGS